MNCNNAKLSDPVYNIEQIIKESLLLEDHLTEPNKRCFDCICKHFLKICALQEEAITLAGENIVNYPLMQDNVVFYNKLFHLWLSKRNQENIYSTVASRLRKVRKLLVGTYILQTPTK